jgi:molybdenum cofactor cytidylyltransferase
LKALESGYEGVFIAPVDIPLVRSFTVKILITAAGKNPGKIVYPVFENRRGHPPLIPGDKVRQILSWSRDETLKSALRRLESEALELSVADRFIHMDLDIPADYERLRESFQTYEIPTDEECKAITEGIYKLSADIRGHCSKVAEVADEISMALAKVHITVDLGSVHAAAMLHDLAKGQPEHEALGARQLREMGFDKVASLVAAHSGLSYEPSDESKSDLEKKIVFLADKLVSGEARVPLEERFESSLARFGNDPSAKANIQKRLEQAVAVKNEIELLLGRPNLPPASVL